MNTASVSIATVQYPLNRMKAWVYTHSEFLRLFTLLALVVYTYSSFLTGSSLGGGDAAWYQTLTNDAIVQVKHSIFPAYLSQSEFNFFGYPQVRAPLYSLFSQFLYLFTFGKLNSFYIQNLTVFFSALAAAFLTYYLLTFLAPRLRWHALLFAFFYISCPGVMGLIYQLDMHYSFMVVPFVPLVIYGLIKFSTTKELSTCILTAIGLSLVWMGHPPLGVVVTGVCILFYGLHFVFRPSVKVLIGISLIFFLLALFNFWQFVPTYLLGVRINELNLNYLLAMARQEIKDVFLPLGWKTIGGDSCLQLGYSYWIVLLTATAIAFKFEKTTVLKVLITCIAVLFIFLYPFPVVGDFLWSIIPKTIVCIIGYAPSQRFYVVLASLCSFVGILTFKKVYDSEFKKEIRFILSGLCYLLFFWNIYQSNFFHATKDVQPLPMPGITNLFLWDTANPLQSMSSFYGTYDPRLQERVLDSQNKPVEGLSNEHAGREYFLKNKNLYFHAFPIKTINKVTYPLLLNSVNIKNRGNYMVIIDVSNSGTDDLVFHASDSKYISQVSWILENPYEHKLIMLPILSSIPNDKITIYLDSVSNPEKLKINSYGIVPYNLEKNDWPIQVHSFVPLRADVSVDKSGTFLEVFKKYYPGYEALVNGSNVKVLISPSNLVLIPLQKGANEVELRYVGTESMRISFYISVLCWCGIGFYFILRKSNLNVGSLINIKQFTKTMRMRNVNE